MVKLAQHIEWPCSEATVPSTTIAAAIAYGGHSDSRVLPQVNQDTFAQDESLFIESTKHGDHRHRKTLADFFESPSLAFSEHKMLLTEKSPLSKQSLEFHLINRTKSLSGTDNSVHTVGNHTKFEQVARNASARKSTDLQLPSTLRKLSEVGSKQASKDRISLKCHDVLAPNSASNMDHKALSIEIPDKMVGVAWLASEPMLLTAGSYSYPANAFILEQLYSEKTGFIKHGHLHRVYIKEGHLGVAWVDGSAILLEPGVSVHSCLKFSHITTDDQMVQEKEFVLGPFRIVTVHNNEIGIKFCNRKPAIIYSGRHCLSISKVEVFAGFESLLRRHTALPGVIGTSSDNVNVQADIHVEWQIKPEDAAAARLANVTDVEGAVGAKLRCAFNLVLWEYAVQDILTLQADSLSSKIQRECLDLFEEGWEVTIWHVYIMALALAAESTNQSSVC